MLPLLLKKDSKGTIRQWAVYSSEDRVVVKHGVQGGKIQERITTCTPKNIGRINETTAEEQAELEAKAKWIKQRDRECYVEDLSHPPAYVQPQLARDYTKVGHQLDWSNGVFATPKLDGVRAIHIPGEGLQSRKGIIYEPMTYLDEPLCAVREALGLKDNQWLDGEVFLMGMPLNRILGAARKANNITPTLLYYIFDIASSEPLKYVERREKLNNLSFKHPNIAVVPAFKIKEDKLNDMHDKFVTEHWEGIMLNESQAYYGLGERIAGLMKYKKFLEKEFEIVDVKEDKDGQGILVYHNTTGAEFSSRSRGTNEYRIDQLVNKHNYIGQQGTVRFFAYSEFGIPQFPITVAIGQHK